MAELDTLLDVALDVADLAGRTTLGHFRTGVRPDWKADATPVTVADREAETVIRDALARRTPTYGVVGEEFGEASGTAPYRWWIDPIDGTKAFVRGVPLYATLVGLERDGVMVAGVASFPALGETLAAAQGRGARLNGRRTYVSDVVDPAHSAVSTTDVGRFEELGRGAAWARVRGAYGYRAGWSDAYGYLLVASGRIEAMLDPAIAPWDVAPFAAILPEAGGWFGTWAGDATPHGADALAVNAAQRTTLLDLLAGER